MMAYLELTEFSRTFLWSLVCVCCILVTLYLVTIVWLTITHIWSIARFLTQYIFVTAKLWIQQLFGIKEKTQSTLEQIELSDIEIPLDSTIVSKTVPQTSTKQKSDQVKKPKSSQKERG